MLITLKDEMVKGAGCSERVEKKRKTIYYMGLFTKPISNSFTLFPCINTRVPYFAFQLKVSTAIKKKIKRTDNTKRNSKRIYIISSVMHAF